MLINIKNADENKGIVSEAIERISNSKDRIKGMSEAEKKYKNVDETLEIIKEILVYNKIAQKNFQLASKFDKGKSGLKPEESIAERVKLIKGRVTEIKKEEKNIIMNCLKNTLLII